MGAFDNLKGKAAELKGKAKDMVDSHGNKVGEGIDKGASIADSKTGGTHGSQISQGADRLKDGLDGLDGQDDDIPNTRPPV